MPRRPGAQGGVEADAQQFEVVVDDGSGVGEWTRMVEVGPRLQEVDLSFCGFVFSSAGRWFLSTPHMNA